MKEIWMEKLVMLLDIYEEEVVGVHSVWEHITEKDEAWIISKKFWFIQWLVENDKIDLDKVKEKIWLERELYDRMLYWYKEEDFLIMILSIEDEPIRFLCEILR
jgi:hypothetical protein